MVEIGAKVSKSNTETVLETVPENYRGLVRDVLLDTARDIQEESEKIKDKTSKIKENTGEIKNVDKTGEQKTRTKTPIAVKRWIEDIPTEGLKWLLVTNRSRFRRELGKCPLCGTNEYKKLTFDEKICVNDHVADFVPNPTWIQILTIESWLSSKPRI